MNELLHSLGDTFRNPSRLHAAVVHLPVAIGIIGVIFVVALALTRGRSSTLRAVALVLYLIGALSGFVAYRSGEAAQEHATRNVMLTDAADAAFEQHEDMGEVAWMFLAGTMLAVGLTAINRPMVRGAFVAIALAASLTTAGWIVLTAHYGGALVYQHGIGVPASPNNVPAGTQP
jgi:uncharacterized membrane protein